MFGGPRSISGGHIVGYLFTLRVSISINNVKPYIYIYIYTYHVYIYIYIYVCIHVLACTLMLVVYGPLYLQTALEPFLAGQCRGHRLCSSLRRASGGAGCGMWHALVLFGCFWCEAFSMCALLLYSIQLSLCSSRGEHVVIGC